MKKLIMLCVLGISLPAYAATYTGKWADTALEGAFDLTGDGIHARGFRVDVYDSLKFQSISGGLDTTIIAFPGGPGNSCPNPAAELELEPTGIIVFKSWKLDAIFTEADSSQHLCFNPANPEETLHLNIVGGAGVWAGATGTAVAIIRDTVLAVDPATGFPQIVYSTGEFTIQVD